MAGKTGGNWNTQYLEDLAKAWNSYSENSELGDSGVSPDVFRWSAPPRKWHQYAAGLENNLLVLYSVRKGIKDTFNCNHIVFAIKLTIHFNFGIVLALCNNLFCFLTLWSTPYEMETKRARVSTLLDAGFSPTQVATIGRCSRVMEDPSTHREIRNVWLLFGCGGELAGQLNPLTSSRVKPNWFPPWGGSTLIDAIVTIGVDQYLPEMLFSWTRVHQTP